MKLSHGLLTASTVVRSVMAAQATQQVLERGGGGGGGDAGGEAGAWRGAVQIAIIGAGAGGSSAAFHLHHGWRDGAVPVNVTVFERSERVGGRATTVAAYGDPAWPVELGASIFVPANRILTGAVARFQLDTTGDNDNPKGARGSAVGVWDGRRFVVELDGGWWDAAKLVWKYGLAPVRTRRLTQRVVARFLRMYEARGGGGGGGGVFPFTSLTQAARDVGLRAATAATGEQYMRAQGITGDFGRDVVQASTRVNYAQNLKYIHGLEAMVCMATDGAMAVRGGNWQMFAKMVEASAAKVHLHTSVEHVHDAAAGGYTLAYRSRGADVVQTQHFDVVIVAGPHQHANITLPPSAHTPDAVPYVSLHVTLFTSPHRLSPRFFGRASDAAALPRVILTTLPDAEPPGDGAAAVGRPGFYSISLLRPIVNPNTGAGEFLYKVFSAAPLTDAWLSRLLGVGDLPGRGPGELDGRDVTWMCRKVWNSYPYEYPRVTFEHTKLADGIWYTGGMDSFISTMETNALMGKNVAALILDELAASRVAQSG